MSEAAEYAIGAQVHCEQGPCGELLRVVVDPVKRAITHLVVGERHGQDVDRLVPIDLVESATERDLRLHCTLEQFAFLEVAEETKFVQPPGGQWGYGQGQMLMLPFFGLGGMGMLGGLGMGGLGMGGPGVGGLGVAGSQQRVTYDKVPPGEVEVQRGQHVHASDGAIGHVRGLVIDPSDHQVTHVLLDEGHLWGKKEVSIPISAVIGVDGDGVRVRLTKAEIADLPPVVDVDVDGKDGTGDQPLRSE